MLQGQGGFQWDQARAFAIQLATGGTSEPNPDPMERIQLEQLARVAELHVGRVTGLSTSVTGRPLTIVPVSRATWVHGATDACRRDAALAHGLNTEAGQVVNAVVAEALGLPAGTPAHSVK